MHKMFSLESAIPLSWISLTALERRRRIIRRNIQEHATWMKQNHPHFNNNPGPAKLATALVKEEQKLNALIADRWVRTLEKQSKKGS